jgi:malonyl-CoA O-methyltransferase
VLRYPGVFLFATLGPDSLKELRRAWRRADGMSHVQNFTDMHDIGDALIAAGFVEPVVDSETLSVAYRDIKRLVCDLRGVGATNLAPGRRLSLTGRRRWAAMAAAYESERDAAGMLPVTIQVTYGHAWSRDPAAVPAGSPGEIAVPIERLHRRS